MTRRQVLALALMADIACWTALIFVIVSYPFIFFLLKIWG
jgi:hypothetical protein